MKNIKKTNGLEFYTLDGLEYRGFYYVDSSTNVAYIYNKESNTNQILVPRHTFNTETVRLRNKIKGGSMSPKPYIPIISEYDYSVGMIPRYFIQKRSSPLSTIMEIDQSQYAKVKASSSKNSISSKIYRQVSIEWVISGNKDYVFNINTRNIEQSEINFNGLKNYLKNPLEFYR
jgi:hypothetical protein